MHPSEIGDNQKLGAHGPVPWSTGLCDCFDDVGNCCITCWCPCITFGQISEIIDKGSSSCALNGAIYVLFSMLVGCHRCYSCFYRSKMREQYSLDESPCFDCCVHFCCETCALCQEYRELKSRDFDMSIGWQGNVEKNTTCNMTSDPLLTENGFSVTKNFDDRKVFFHRCTGVQMMPPPQAGVTMNR